MGQEWYYTSGGKNTGPVSAKILQQLADERRLQPEDLVWREGMEKWVPARSIKGLFSVSPPPSPASAAPPPAPDSPPVAEPPSNSRNSKYCHECGSQIRVRAEICPQCGVRQPKLPGSDYASAEISRSGVKIPLLISAISNIVIGLFWLSFCVTIIFTIPMIVLCIFELSLWARADGMPAQKLGEKAKFLAFFEIIMGLANLPTLICGIINMINGSKLASTLDEHQ